MYDTGLIDSSKVQEKHALLFRGIMEKLKAQLFADYKNPFIIADSFSIPENECLKDMESIYLVVHDERGFRLSQACDILNLLPLTWEEQTEQKSKIKCKILHRDTSNAERDLYTLGMGEDHSLRKVGILLPQLTNSFWSCETDILIGYGLGVSTQTEVQQIIKIADVDRNWTIVQDKIWGIDKPGEYNYNLWVAIKNDTGVYNDDHISDYVDNEYGDVNQGNMDNEFSILIYLYDWLQEYIQEKTTNKLTEEQVDSELQKEGIQINKLKSAIDRNDDFYNNYDWKSDAPIGFDEVSKFKKYAWTAEGGLELFKEINFVYHPWVTVAEIQEHRVYNPEAAPPSKKQRTQLFKF